MVDVKIVFSKKNRQFEIIRAYDGHVFYKSGLYKNFENARLGIEIKFKENPNWRLVDDKNVQVIHK